MSERTLVLVKPDGVARGLVGEVISRIERKGLKLAALEL
ncbi:nucleoside-diphosphate kinase, partial [Allokutzneria sp. NRRL B-24872]